MFKKFCANKVLKDKTMKWCQAAAISNAEYFKFMPQFMLISTSGFLVNLACLFMTLSHPFTKDPAQYLKHFSRIDT